MVNTRSRKISNEKDDKSNSEDESLSGRDEQVEIIDEQRKASKKTSNRNSNLQRVRRAKTVAIFVLSGQNQTKLDFGSMSFVHCYPMDYQLLYIFDYWQKLSSW